MLVARRCRFSLSFVAECHGRHLLSVRNFSSKKERPRLTSEKAQAKHFIDFKKIKVGGGAGGCGNVSFLNLFGNEFAGPSGGNGGNGGHVVFKAEPGINSLTELYPVMKGAAGEKGGSKHCSGKNAETLFVKVPVGTFFRDEAGNIVGDLKETGDMFLAARGGAGGRGNYFFLSNDNRAPRTYEEGGVGEEKTLYAELRIIADVGLIGLPNAGKSSLLRCLTRAKPKIGYYPFTTLYPHVGVMEFDDYEHVSVADIPGLIDGAHMNKGLGFSFLRHVEQCHSLVYVIDLSYETAVEQLEMLKDELERYQPGLSAKSHIVVGNKIDLDVSQANLNALSEHLRDSGTALVPVSAKKRTNILQLISSIRHLYDLRSGSSDGAKQ